MSHNEFTISEPIEPQEASPMKHEMNVLGIDIAKHVFHAVGMDDTGKIVWRKRLSRHDLVQPGRNNTSFRHGVVSAHRSIERV
jgi:hypothetical protein